jgi:D-lactate dehydrogenase (cytochrome)
MSKLRVPVTIAGVLTGNTAVGLAFGGAVLSLEKLNKIEKIKRIYDDIALITVQAGSRVCDIKSKVQSGICGCIHSIQLKGMRLLVGIFLQMP